MEILGIILLAIGFIISGGAGIWFLVVAFRESVLWGLCCLFIPFASLFFLIVHWSEAKRPFFWSLLSIVPLVAGAMLAEPSASTTY